jgi:hypothetical protein
LWAVRDDGQLALLLRDKQQEVFAWTRFTTEGVAGDGVVESCCVVPTTGEEDEIWWSVKRDLNGSTVRTIEYFLPRNFENYSDMHFVDCGINYTSGGTNLLLLEGETVQATNSGDYLGEFTVASGGITLPTGVTSALVGIPVTSTLTPMPLDINGLGISAKSRVVNGVLSFYNTIGGQYGIGSDLFDLPFRNAGDNLNESPPLFTGLKEVDFNGTNVRDATITIKQDVPFPMTVRGIVYNLDANEG